MNELELTRHYQILENDKFSLDDIEKLSNLLEYHSDLYYNKEEPIISDFEYDTLFKKLEFLEKKIDVKSISTAKVWSDVISSTFEKVFHSRPMISLDNTYNNEDLIDFDERVRKLMNNEKWIIKSNSHPEQLFAGFLIQSYEIKQSIKDSEINSEWQHIENLKIHYSLEFKFDWLWVELIYKNWKLVQALTRWNWVEGEDITQNVLTIKNIPKNINYLYDLEVRGEVVMPISSFERLNEEALKTGEKIFSNPRNAASWSLRLLDYSVTKKRNLKYFAYDIANLDEYIKDLPQSRFSGKEGSLIPPLTKGKLGEGSKITYQDVINSLEKLWFEISSFFPLCNWIDEVIKEIENFWDTKSKIDFDIDWLVLKVNDISLWQQIWFTAHHPRYAIAYKFPSTIVTTKILSVDHQVWRTGTITPVANLEPVNIGWVIVKRVTLHNYDEIKNLGVKIWDTIFLKRAWEVIPKVVSVVFDARNWQEKDIEIPKFCPICNTHVLKDDDKVRYYCPNTLWCRAQVVEKLINSVWKSGLNIDWLWTEQVELFFNLWFITDLSSVFDLSSKKEDILKLPWYKEKSVSNLLLAIENSKTVDIVNLLIALNIPGIWKSWAKELSKFINTPLDLINFSHTIEELEAINDIWELTARTVFDFFNNETNKDLIKKLLKNITINFRQEIVWGKYNWLKICITWSFDWYSRDQLVEILEKQWWSFVSAISSKTDYLLAWEKAWSKLKKAQELWVKVIILEEFLNV